MVDMDSSPQPIDMSDLLERLKVKYPTHKILSEPLPDCSCKGTGERQTKERGKRLCFCPCVTGTDEVRRDAVKAFYGAMKKIREDILRERAR